MSFLRLLLACVVGVVVGVAVRSLLRSSEAKTAVVQPTPEPEKVFDRAEETKHAAPPAEANNPVFKRALEVRGYSRLNGGKRISIEMSDGTRITERDKELEAVERNSVTISGVKYALKPVARVERVQERVEVKSEVKSEGRPVGRAELGKLGEATHQEIPADADSKWPTSGAWAAGSSYMPPHMRRQ